MPHTERCFNLVDWQVDPVLNRLTIDNKAFDLEPRVMQVLICLYNHSEEPVSKDDLLDEVWHGISITDDAIYCSISKLRKIFRQVDECRSPQLKTISRQGYMLSMSPAYQVSPIGFDLNQNENENGNGLDQYGQKFGRRHDDHVSASEAKSNGKIGIEHKSTKSPKKIKRLALSSELKPIKLKFYINTQKVGEYPKSKKSRKKLKVLLLLLLLVLFMQSLYIVFM
ncbi:winged helix-turn-helix domain-containing protein [Kangiella sp.]|uniref:winged helix-turn-helix domain-containing protein n=1 Tax=Kangiella sp. TaxID=1920245 RepID=UPI003A91A65B